MSEYNITVCYQPFSNQVLLLIDLLGTGRPFVPINCFTIIVLLFSYRTFHYQCYSVAIEVFTLKKQQLYAHA